MRRGVRGIEPAYYIEFGSGTSIYYSIERYCYFFPLVGRRRSVCFDFNRIVINTCKISGERTIIDNKKLFFLKEIKLTLKAQHSSQQIPIFLFMRKKNVEENCFGNGNSIGK